MKDYQAKLILAAKLLEGLVVDDTQRVQVCVKGIVLGFPATLEAIRATYPFGLTYLLETNLIEDPTAQAHTEFLRLVITPRIARGLFSFISRLLLLEARGQTLDIPQIDSTFICTFNLTEEARRFMRYPGIEEKLLELRKYSRFSELLIRADAGLCLTQPTSFNALDLDVCRETFRLLAEIGQVIFDAFS